MKFIFSVLRTQNLPVLDDNANQSAAQILAKKLYEDEKRAREERKRKRDEDEAIIKKGIWMIFR